MMVIIRAQDFASRQLRRASAEFSGLSKAQMIAARQSDVTFRKMRALGQLQLAQAAARPLSIIETHNRLLRQQAMTLDRLTQAQANLDKVRRARTRTTLGTFGPRSPQMIADIRAAEQAVGSLQTRHDRLAQSIGRVEQQVIRLPRQYQLMRTNADAFASAQQRANLRLLEAHNALNQSQRAQLAFNQAVNAMPAQRLSDVGHALGNIGRTMQLFGAAGTAAFGFAAREAAEFSRSASLAATQVTRIGAGTREAQANADQLRAAILRLSVDYPFAAQEMAEATYEIFSSTNVQNIGEGIGLLEAFSRAAVAGQTDLMTATKASITVLNTFRGANESVAETLNRMFSIVRFGRMRFQDFAEMLPKVAAAAYGSGQSLDDVAGIMAFLTRKTGDASIAATQISRAFDVLGRAEFRKGIQKLGVDIEDAQGRLLPLPQVMKKIMDAWGNELDKGGKASERFIQIVTRAADPRTKGLLSTAEARRFFRFVFSDFKQYMQLQKQTTENNKEFQRSFETLMADPGVQWQVFVNRFKTLVVEIGEAAIPVFARIGDAIAGMLDWWNSLDEGLRDSIVQFGAWASIGALVAGVILGIAGPLVTLVAHFKLWKMAAAGAGGATMTFATALRAIPLVGLGVLLTQIVGIERAVKIMALGWIAWKTTAIAAAAAVAIANRVAATSVSFAWKRALVSTGIGAFVVAAGLLLEQFIFHWERTRDRLYDIWDELRIRAIDAALKIIDPFTHVPGFGVGVFDEFRQAKDFLERELGNVRISQHMREEANATSKALDQLVRESPKKAKKLRAEFFRQLRTGDFAPGTNREVILRQAQDLNAAFARVKAAHKDAANDTVKTWENWQAKLDKAIKKGDQATISKLLGLDTPLADLGDQFDEMGDRAGEWRKQLALETERARTQTVDNLRNMYIDMENANRQAFGQLFQGPWLTSETFDLAKEWGITPRIQDMIKDLNQQNNQFARWRERLDKLMKRGVPAEFINEIRNMGIEEGSPIIENMLKATPQQMNQLISQWKRRNTQIKSATKMDFQDEINRFRKAGGDMGQAIINGFQQAQVGAWFDGWIQTKFPDVINAAVNKAVSDWKVENPAPPMLPTIAKPAGATSKNPGGVGTTGKGGSTTTDNSRSQTIMIDIAAGALAGGSSTEEVIRKAAFVARTARWNP
jgi:TP901 family phage tail tape measure protein